MHKTKLKLFKKLLSIQSISWYEDAMISYILEIIITKWYSYTIDEMGNITITKWVSDSFVCLLAHMDTVHSINKNMRVFENITEDWLTSLYWVDITNSEYSGIGWDNKCWIFVALELLDSFDNLKVCFTVQEEVWWKGSQKIDSSFFDNVWVFTMFDEPWNAACNLRVWGLKWDIELFDINSSIYTKNQAIFSKYWYTIQELWWTTDIGILSERFNIPWFLLSCWYYNIHKPYEYIIVEDLDRALKFWKAFVKNLQKIIKK